MKGQQISPWSIYNPHPSEDPLNAQQPSNETIQNISLPPIVKKRKIPKQHSQHLTRAAKIKQIREGSNISFLFPKKEAKTPAFEGKKEDAVTKQQLQETAQYLNKKNEQRAILSLMFHELSSKPGYQILKIPVVDPENDSIRSTETLKTIKVVQLPKINPRMDAIKSSIISSCEIGLQDLQQSIDMSQQMPNKILKQKIEKMISQKMKILSKKKQIIARENNSKLYNFF